jgi:hypothetical protein
MILRFSTPSSQGWLPCVEAARGKFASVGNHAQGVAGACSGTSMTELGFHLDSNLESYNSTIQIHPRFPIGGMQEGS